eukprot:gene9303-6542_t
MHLFQYYYYYYYYYYSTYYYYKHCIRQWAPLSLFGSVSLPVRLSTDICDAVFSLQHCSSFFFFSLLHSLRFSVSVVVDRALRALFLCFILCLSCSIVSLIIIIIIIIIIICWSRRGVDLFISHPYNKVVERRVKHTTRKTGSNPLFSCVALYLPLERNISSPASSVVNRFEAKPTIAKKNEDPMPTRHRLNTKVTIDRSTNPSEERQRHRQREVSPSPSNPGHAQVPKRPAYPHDGPRGGGRRQHPSSNIPGSASNTKKRPLTKTERLAKQYSNRGEVPPEPAPAYLVTPSTDTDRAYSTVGMQPLTPRPETGVRSRSRTRSRSRAASGSPNPQDEEEGPRLHDIEQPTFVVGNAILNPYVPVAPSVQQLVQIVPTLLSLPDSALRQPLGGSLQPPPTSGRRAKSQQGAFSSKPVSPRNGADVTAAAVAAATEVAAAAGATSLFSSQIRRLFPQDGDPGRLSDDETACEDEAEALAAMAQKRLSATSRSDPKRDSQSLVDENTASGQLTPYTTDIIPGLDGVCIDAGTQLLCIEEVLGVNGESAATKDVNISPAEVELAADGSVRPPVIRRSVLGLQKLYATTTNDIAVVHGMGGTAPPFTAAEVLPVLRRAEERVQELAAARRLVDWDVTIPTAETIPPPAIAFLDENGAAVHNMPSVVFHLDSTSLRLSREDSTAVQQLNSTAVTTAPPPQGKIHLNAQSSVGKHITYEDGVHRVHGLVGIMIGLAEKVGLDRVMEFEVQTTSHELFVASPYVDSESGDLVLQMNSTVQGTIRLILVGHDCGSVDPERGVVQKSVNQLECVIKVQYAHDAPNKPPAGTAAGAEQQKQQELMNPISGGVVHEDEEGRATFVFAGTNPHELRYEECRQATREFLSNKSMLQEKEKQAAAAIIAGGSGLVSSGPPLQSDLSVLLDNSEHNTSLLGGTAGVFGAASTSMNAPALPRAGNSGSSDGLVGNSNSSLQRVLDTVGPCEPMTTCIAFHMSSFQHLLMFFRLPIWQDMLTALLPPAPLQKRPSTTGPESVSTMSEGGDSCSTSVPLSDRATKALFIGPKSYAARQRFVDNARAVLGNVANKDNFIISVTPIAVHLRPTGPGQVIANDKNIQLLRDLVLILTLEHPRSRRHQFHETVNLCHRLYHSALLKTLSSTRGTPEGLEQIAKWVILPEAERPAACWRHPLFPDGHLVLPDKERKSLEQLADCLAVGMCACFRAGAISEAIFFATQRVYTMCILRDGADTAVCTAQRQLAELYCFFGDYAAAQQLAVDVVALSEKLYDVDAPELTEAQVLSALCHLSANQVDTGMAILNDLFSHVLRRSPHIPPLLACIIQLFVLYAQPSCSLYREYFPDLTVDDPVPHIDGVLRMIAGDSFLPPELQKPSVVPPRSGQRRSQHGLRGAHLGDFLGGAPLPAGAHSPNSKWMQNLFRCNDPRFFLKSSTGEEDELTSGHDEEQDESFALRMQSFLLVLCGVLLIRAGAHCRGVGLLRRALERIEQKISDPSRGCSSGAPPVGEKATATVKPEDDNGHRIVSTNTSPPTPNSEHAAEAKGSRNESSTVGEGSDAPLPAAAVSVGESSGRDLGSSSSNADPPKSAPNDGSSSAIVPVGSLPGEGSTTELEQHEGEAEAEAAQQHEAEAEACGPFNDSDPFGHCERVAATIAAQAAVWHMWSEPNTLQDSTERLRESTIRMEQSWGPIHPYTAMAQLLLAQALQNSPHSHALSLARRGLSLLRRCTSARSWYFLLAHRTLSRLYTLVHQWKDALEHTNAALILAQLNFCTDDIMSQVEEDFMGCLLRCPPGTVVRLDHLRLLTRLQERIAHLEAIYGMHTELLVWPLVNLAEAYYILRDLEAAMSCLQRAVRLADPKGSLFVTTSTLKPASLLPSKEAVQRRDVMIISVLQTRDRVLQLSQVLFTMAAVLEGMGSISDAQDCYSRCLALLESAGVESSLSAIRVYTAVAKLLYSAQEYGDSLGWARKADRLTHSHYPEWLQESQITRSLLAIVEHRLFTEEGTFVTVNPHNLSEDFVELI